LTSGAAIGNPGPDIPDLATLVRPAPKRPQPRDVAYWLRIILTCSALALARCLLVSLVWRMRLLYEPVGLCAVE
jgi:hypothetical protein